MTNEGQRTSIQPEDWPLEEANTDGNSSGLRSDTGTSSGDPLPGETDPGAPPAGGRGPTGTMTPGERGTDQEPR